MAKAKFEDRDLLRQFQEVEHLPVEDKIVVKTTLAIELPDNIAREAKDAGLPTPGALAPLLKDAVRRQAGRHLQDAAKRIQATGIPPMSDEEIVAEVKTFRARQAKADHTGRS